MTDELLDKMRHLGPSFFAESKLPGQFKLESFVNSWHTILKLGAGALFRADRRGELVGMIGGLICPDLYDGEIVCHTSFWFVVPTARGRLSIQLLEAFEDWAREVGAKRVVVTHLSSVESLGLLYSRRGYQPLERSYVRKLWH